METNWKQYFTKFIKNHNDKPWDWRSLSFNEFKKDKDLFELIVGHQKFVQEQLWEEFVKVYMHPNRIRKLINMGYTICEIDNLL